MALLIGQEAEGAEAEVAPGVEVGSAFTFKALKTGTLTALHVKFSANGTGTKSRIAIQADEAGKPKVGVLAEGEITSNTAGEHEATGLSVAVTEGTTYWLTVLPLGGNLKYKPGSTTARRSAVTKRTTIAAIEAADWGATLNKGPVSIWGTGSEGTEVKEVAGTTKLKLKTSSAVGIVSELAAICKVKIKDAGAIQQLLAAEGTTKVKVKDSDAVNQSSALASTTKVTIKDSAAVSQGQIASLEGTTAIRFKDSIALIAAPAIAGTTKVRFADSAQAQTVAELAAQAKVRFKAPLAVGVSASIATKSRITFATHARVQLVETGGKKVVLFIFED